MANEELIDYIVKDFSSAIVSNIDESDKPTNGFKEIKNARIDVEDGSLVKRLQDAYYNASSLGSLPIKSGVRYYYGTSSKELIVSYDTMLKKGNDTAGTFSDIKTGLTSNQRFSFVQYKDRLYCFNGVDSNGRYDGTNFKTMGCPIPGSSPTAAEGSSGVLDAGTYQYKVTFLYDGFQESNPNATAASVTVGASKQVALSGIPTGASGQGVTARKIYRTLAGGSVYYYVGKISDNTTTTYSDNTADSSLTVELNTNHDIPPIWKMAVLHQDRLFGLVANSCEIDFTLIEGYVACPDIHDSVNNYIKVNEDDGEDVISIIETDSGILCFKRSGTYLINTSAGSDPLLWTIDKVDVHGICSPFSPARTAQGVIYLSLDKENELDLRLFTGSSSRSIGWRIKDILNSINNNYYDEITGYYKNGRYYLSFIDNYAGLSYNHKLLVLQFNDDFSRFGYTVDDKNIDSFIPAFGVGDFGQVYAGLSNLGKVIRIETATSDLIHRTSADINSGTLTRLDESGTEEYPEFKLDSDGFTGRFSNTPIDSLTATIDSYSTIDDTIDNSGYITSAVLYIGATALYKAYWAATLGTDGGSALRIRTGDTAASCSTASWSAWFTDSTGADISAVTANKYIQYQLLISSDSVSDTITKLYRDDFIVKISAGLGSPFETYINFLLDTGKVDLGYKDQIKRLRQVVVEYETTGTTLNLYLSKDDDSLGSPVEAINTTTYANIRQVILPFNYIGEFFRLKLSEQSLLSVKIKSVRLRFSVLPKNSQILLRGR